jgi:poly(A) polymerase Pap1
LNAEDSLRRAEDLLARLEHARNKLESTEDPEAALEVLTELAEIAKQVEAEISQARRVTDEEEHEQGGEEPDAAG